MSSNEELPPQGTGLRSSNSSSFRISLSQGFFLIKDVVGNPSDSEY